MPTRQEIIIGENEVVTIDKYKIALARVWDESEGEAIIKKAWLVVAEKGVAGSSRDIEIKEGAEFELGEKRLLVIKIDVSSEKAGSMVLKELTLEAKPWSK